MEGETAERSSIKPEVNVSAMSLFDKSTLYTAFLPMGSLVNIAKESGYGGFEWHPLRGTVSGLQVNSGLIGKDSKDAIVSLHQSWRSEKSLAEALKHPNRSLATIAYVILPERIASLNDLEHLQKVLGKKLPVVLYPSLPDEESGTERDFGEKIFQPYADIMARWGVKTVDELISEAYKRGYTGFAIDLFHMRRPNIDGVGLNPWQETLPQLLPHTKEVHISAGRTDLHYVKGMPDTESELKGLLDSKGDTELLQMLRAIRESGWKGRVVTEIPAIALHQLRREAGQSSSIKTLIQDHRKIVGNIQDILA